MRLQIVKEVFLKELRETLRDRRSMAVMFGIPILLYPLLTMSTAGLGASTYQRMTEQKGRLALENPGAAPHLVRLINSRNSGLQIFETVEVRAALAADQIDVALVVPPKFEVDALAARDTEIRVLLDRSRTAASFAEGKVTRLLDNYQNWLVEQRLKKRGVPVSVVRPLKVATDDVASSERRFGSILAILLPTMLLITGMLGAFYPAVNAATAERELGTLETLLVTPAGKMELLLGKVGLVLLSGLLTAALNMLSMALVVWRSLSAAAEVKGTLAISPGMLGLTYLAAVPTIIFFAAGILVVGLFSRSFKEASSYSTPVMLLATVPILVSIAEPKTTPGLLVMPIVNTTVVIRDVLDGSASLGGFLLAFGSSLLYAALTLSLAARLFSTEDLVNPAWEPLSLKGLRASFITPARGGGTRLRVCALRPRRLPAVDEALALYALSLLLLFYVGPTWLSGRPSGQRFFSLLAGSEILLTAAPALLFAALGRYRLVETFSWRRPGAPALIGGALLGIGMIPWMHALAAAQNRIWPADPEAAQAVEKLLRGPLQQNPFLTIAAVGVLAGVCEELLYRGPIQAALTAPRLRGRRLNTGFALAVGAVLFALAHLDPHGFLPRGILGFFLGWMVLRSGSIFPAMLAHGLYDATTLALARWGPKGSPFDLDLAASAIGRGFHAAPLLLQLGIGALLLLVALALFRRGTRPSGSAPPSTASAA